MARQLEGREHRSEGFPKNWEGNIVGITFLRIIHGKILIRDILSHHLYNKQHCWSLLIPLNHVLKDVSSLSREWACPLWNLYIPGSQDRYVLFTLQSPFIPHLSVLRWIFPIPMLAPSPRRSPFFFTQSMNSKAQAGMATSKPLKNHGL